jgi:AcrR family transcriptional regulator
MRSTPSEPLSPLKAARRERLLDAAERIFQADGFRGASMERLAEAAGVSKVTLYGYFPDKEAAFIAVAERFAERLGVAFAAELNGPGDLVTRIARALTGKHLAVFELVRRSAEARDLFATQARLAGGIFARMDEGMIAQLAVSMKTEGVVEPERVAKLLFAASQGIANVGSDQLGEDIGFLVAKLLGREAGSKP